LRIDVAELLVRERRVVRADEQIGAGTIVLDLRFRLRHLLAQRFDFAGQPLAGGTRLVLFGGLLEEQITQLLGAEGGTGNRGRFRCAVR
jgi:hypothetical protein